jgi:hypothetical protein
MRRPIVSSSAAPHVAEEAASLVKATHVAFASHHAAAAARVMFSATYTSLPAPMAPTVQEFAYDGCST